MCSALECPKHTEYSGGKFRLVNGQWFCDECAKWQGQLGAPCASRYEFTTTHFNGKPVRVRGLNHLRQCEKEFGVSSCIANMEQRNWDKHTS